MAQHDEAADAAMLSDLLQRVVTGGLAAFGFLLKSREWFLYTKRFYFAATPLGRFRRFWLFCWHFLLMTLRAE